MNTLIISTIAIMLYIAAGSLLTLRLIKKDEPSTHKKTIAIILGFMAVLLHGVALSQNLLTAQGINFGIFNATSLLTFLMALLLLISLPSKPIENLGIAIFPMAALSILIGLLIPTEHVLTGALGSNIEIHILISITAYSVLSIAALQALLLAIQDTHLHNKHPGGFIRSLPPLQTMETILFQMIGLGFILQSLSLITGIVFLEDIFAQHLVHKSILSLLAWVLFAILLWGRWRFGWRGNIAIRWTLGGFISLFLAYIGSKMVLEIMLGNG